MLKFFRIATVVLLIAWMVVIFSLSAQTAEKSSKTSGSVIAMVIRIFYPDFDELSKAEQEELIAPFQFVVRKGAHFTAYAVLGALSFLSVVTYKRLSMFWRGALSVAVCFLYCISDEMHQIFVPGRSGEIRDVCIDLCGSLLAISVLILIFKKSNLKICKKFV